jgi:iron(III) transport system ATP-binding protein
MTAVLSLVGLTKSFAGRTVVDNVSLDVGEGEVVCLLGGSGSGKSTTLRIAAGIERPEGGTVAVDGVTVDAPAIFVPPEKRRVGLVFQDLALFPHLNARANAAFGLFRLSRAEANARADELLKTVGLSHLATAFPHQLSGGEQQRLAVARALAPRPRAMLLDEPFSGLDERLRDDVRRDVLSILRGQGAATLLVTHDPDEALRCADRIVLLRAGRAVQIGTPADLFGAPADLETAAFFSPINRIDAKVANGQAVTPFGPVAAPGRAEGAPVTVALRPRDFERAGAAGAPLTVQAVQTASDGLHVEGGGWRVLFDGGDPIAPGQTIAIKIRPGRGFVFAADATPIAASRRTA